MLFKALTSRILSSIVMPRRPRPAHRRPPAQGHYSNQSQAPYPQSNFPSKVCSVKSESESEGKHIPAEECRRDSGNYEDIGDSDEEDNASDADARRVAVWEADHDLEGELIRSSNEVGLVDHFHIVGV